MAKVDGRVCNLCGERITMVESVWVEHGSLHHPDHFLQGFATVSLKPRFGEKNYFNPETGVWHTDRRHLARELKSIGWSNEKFYLTHGKTHMVDVWCANENDPKTGNLANTNTCGCCGKTVKFNQWDYDKFCSPSCGTKWYADNTDRVNEAMATLRERKEQDPDHCLIPNQLRYWTNKGLTEEEGKEKVRERNAVNSKESYIKRAGGDVEAGLAAHADRQERWQASMRASGMLQGYSKRSSTLFDLLKVHHPSIEYGTNEKKVRSGNRVFTVDCFHPETNRIIEFYGDYWHANPAKYSSDFFNKNKGMTAAEIHEYDALRIKSIESKGHEVLIVWESDFANDPNGILAACVLFLSINDDGDDTEVVDLEDDPLIIW